MVTFNGRPILIGGETPFEGQNGHVFEFHQSLGFRIMEVSLETPRSGHAAVLVPGTDQEIEMEPALNFTTLPPILVIGTDNINDDSSEVVNFSEDELEALPPQFPVKVRDPTGDIFGGVPFVCGGFDVVTRRKSDKCFKLSSDLDWIPSPSLNKAREGAASVVVRGRGDSLWITGGKSDDRTEGSTEVLASDGNEWEPGPTLPKEVQGLTGHCMLALNEHEVMIIGGKQWEEEKAGGNQTR